jgi:hypothetical protein
VCLGWKLIEYKVAYYLPDRVHYTRRGDYTIPDEQYDELEREYLTLCRKLGVRNSVVHKGHPGFEDIGTEHAMMEVDEDRSSVQLVLSKLGSRKSASRV